ncbi:hydrogenase maturation protein [Streptomyces oceani]|uniref:Hydrogenase maturation protein n=1 Tax=Streptomyces oceani TaxID=1075402 RepID=A0A1E7JMN9_9ACTN|nr:hydrogenase maturation protein [Streptomyces oceani]OEU89108.1 hydrogenase maturation protein [Streptomyces oceani]
MRILLLATAFNSLTQRVFAELGDHGHELDLQLAESDEALRGAVARHDPELVIAPMLTSAIPRDIWSAHTCLIVHPGPEGDRGPSSLDWAIQDGARNWGVTVLQAEDEMDAGPVWASVPCVLPARGKSDLYRNEIADAAMEAVLLAVRRFADGTYRPRGQSDPRPGTAIRSRPRMRQHTRRIHWESDPTETVLRKLRAADSQPGVRDELLGSGWFLHGGHAEEQLRGHPGELLATRDGAICRATVDGAVWIPQLRARRAPGAPRTFRLPATLALGERLPALPEVEAPGPLDEQRRTWSEISYREEASVGILSFHFAAGAMSTDQCRRLVRAYRAACSRPTSVLVLGGMRDFFGNGIQLNVIEAATDPAAESWANIQAMDDLVEAVLTTTDRLTVAALGGNAAAGGAMLAQAADEVWCRQGCVLNPHYRLMGLYGSEYWTYTLPRRTGQDTAERLMREALPISTATAARLGLVDRVLDCAPERFTTEVAQLAADTATAPRTARRVMGKKAALERQEALRPLQAYRDAELAHMRRAFFDTQAPYHRLRSSFVRKQAQPADPAPGPVP